MLKYMLFYFQLLNINQFLFNFIGSTSRCQQNCLCTMQFYAQSDIHDVLIIETLICNIFPQWFRLHNRSTALLILVDPIAHRNQCTFYVHKTHYLLLLLLFIFFFFFFYLNFTTQCGLEYCE